MAMTHIISLIDSIFIGKKQKCHVSSATTATIPSRSITQQNPQRQRPRWIIPNLWCWRILHDEVVIAIRNENWKKETRIKVEISWYKWYKCGAMNDYTQYHAVTSTASNHMLQVAGLEKHWNIARLPRQKIMKCRGRLDKTNPAGLPPVGMRLLRVTASLC